MTRPARLQALRLQGFKSFAERTTVEFVPGINAVIGPNGSGKSNLADALRWALGEQGRALRSRRAEDVVFAGSDRKAALGMADVTLVLDNADGLVPVDFAVLEVGRRLFRSGENDYLVNRQRVRLKDVVELLDAANLADNAFLFIGQGMVDQALALRPEERRPLFEEVAGVRRHERRRRRAETQLEEASANLARVEDILAELRPQVRRLAAQAEQQASRSRAGEELAAALVTALGARWHGAANGAQVAAERLAATRQAAAGALETLQESENRATAAADELASHAVAEAERRAAHEATRTTLATIDLEAATAAAETAGIQRDRDRLAAERAAAEAELAERRRELALPIPSLDPTMEGELAEADRALAEARAEAGALRAATVRRSEAEAALRRAAAARSDEIAGLRRRLAAADAARAAAGDAALGRALPGRRDGRGARGRRARAARDAHAAVDASRERREAARLALADAEAAHQSAAEAQAVARARVATLRGRVEALRARLAADEGRGIAPAARRAGGRAVAGDLDVEPALRPAVAAALGELGRSFVVPHDALARLAGERGIVVLADLHGPGTRSPSVAELEAARTGAAGRGGGLLADGVRADPTGIVRRLLARWAWAPTLGDAVEVAAALPAGWRVVARDGGLAGSDGVVAIGVTDAPLERRTELDSIAADLAAAEAEGGTCAERLAAAEKIVAGARAEAEAARRAEAETIGHRRTADETERQAGRSAEHAAREAAWSTARAATLEEEMRPLRERLTSLEATAPLSEIGDLALAESGVAGALATWESRAAELAGRRESLAAARAARDAERRAAEGRRARAEASAQTAEERIGRADAEAALLERRGGDLEAARAARDLARAEAVAREATARAALEAVRAADAAGRDRLRRAEADVATAREVLRRTEDAHRTAEVHEMEARLGLDAVREQALVEFAGLGEVGLRALDPSVDVATARGRRRRARGGAGRGRCAVGGGARCRRASQPRAADDVAAAVPRARGGQPVRRGRAR